MQAWFLLITGRESEEVVPINQYARLSGVGSCEATVAWAVGVLMTSRAKHTADFYPAHPLLVSAGAPEEFPPFHPAVNSQRWNPLTKGRLCLFRVTGS